MSARAVPGADTARLLDALLAGDVPEADAAPDVVRRLEPAVVGLSTTIGDDPDAVPAAIDAIRAARPEAGIIVGGARADGAARQRDVRAVHRAGEALAVVEAMVARPA